MSSQPIEGFPLSPQQRRLWALSQTQPSADPRLAAALYVQGPLIREHLHSALQQLVEQYELLRTDIQPVPGLAFPLQVVAPHAAVDLAISDLSSHTPEQQRERLSAIRAALRNEPSDVAQPALRAHLVVLGANAHALLLTLPALAADQVSLTILAQQLSQAYAIAAGTQPGPLPPPDLQYVDVAAWLNDLLVSPEGSAGRDFWQAQQWETLHTIDLPLARSPHTPIAYEPNVVTLALDPSLTARIHDLVRQQQTDPAAVILTAWLVLLHRIIGQSDLLLGVAAAGRSIDDLAPVLGPLARTLPLRFSLDAQQPFSAALRQVHTTLRAADDWQEWFSWDALSDAADTAPVCPFGFAWLDAPAPISAGELVWSLEPSEAHLERCTIALSASQPAHALRLSVHYDAARLSDAAIRPLVQAAVTLLAQAVATPQMAGAVLPLLDPAQAALDLRRESPAPPQDSARCVQRQFAAQADRTPDRIALVDGARRLSYAALDARANQLAQYLQGCGVGPDNVVALALDRSLEFVVGLLGVLKAGAAYVPLDPEQPAQRLRSMLDITRASALLTTAAVRSRLPDLALRLIDLDADWPAIAELPAVAPSSAVSPSNLAYVIFTSGSTGQPKGVAVEHRQLSAYIDAILERLAVPSAASWGLISTVAADLGHTTLFPALVSGGTLHLIGSECAADPDALAAYLAHAPLDVLKIVPSHLRALLSGAHPERIVPRHRLVLGGEAPDGALIAQIAALSPDCQVFNHYGPTETTVGALALRLLRSSPPAQPVPLGDPLAHSRVYLLDQRLQALPPGVIGELYIGGAGVARGYLDRPDLTAELFIPDPWSTTPGARLYCTGDRMRATADGTLLFLGRADDQLKLRGFRIELAEIEAALRQHPQVRDAAVLARPSVGDELQIVAYVVEELRTKNGEREPRTKNQEPEAGDEGATEQGSNGTREQGSNGAPSAENRESSIGGREHENNKPTDQADMADGSRFSVLGSSVGSQFSVLGSSAGSSDLRAFLAERLPAYMLPTTFVLLPALPLTPNGKLDRAALPAPVSQQPTPELPVVAPRTPLEQQLADLWTEVLGTPIASIHDHFFLRGGHSLLVTRLIARIRATFGVDLPLRSIFEAPLLADLAAQIAEAQSSLAEVEIGPLLAMPRDQPLPLTFNQQALWFIDRLTPGGNAAYTIALALRINGPLDHAALETSFNALVARHEPLRTIFPAAEGQPIQQISPPAPLRLALVDLRDLAPSARDAEARRLATADAGTPFHIEAGPLLRVHLLRLDEREHVLLLAMHHLISDGWSLRVMARDLVALYLGATTGAAVELPALAVQYADYAVWQRRYLAPGASGTTLERQLDYWCAQLADAPATLDLPNDFVRPADATFAGAVRSFTFSSELLRKLHALSHATDATLFMTLLAAWQALLMRLSGQTDLVVGTPVAGRTRLETEPLIGLFINTLAIRTDLSGNPCWRTLIERVRRACLEAYEHQDVPFDQLVAELRPQRALSHNPLFQVMFSLQTIPSPPLDVPEITMATLEVDAGTSMFDLTMQMIETPEGLYGLLEYSAALFKADTIERMIEQFERLLTHLAADIDQPIMAGSLLTAAEQQMLLVDWNASPALVEVDRPVHELFAAQAARTPEAIAVIAGPQQLSYAELDRRANQLAHALRAEGITPGTLVGVCLARSLDLVVALLGVLKAGAAYVPLDPANPPARLRLILADTRTPLVLTTQEYAEQLRSTLPASAARLLCLDADAALLAAQPTTALPGFVTPQHPAYAIYTSGSTGQPKGVLIDHAAISRHCAAFAAACELTAADRVLQFCALSFDTSLEEVLPTLLCGATLVLRDAALWDASTFAAQIAALGITLVDLPTAYWNMLVQSWAAPDTVLPAHRLRLVMVGGEVLAPAALERWRQTPLRTVPLLNSYGPTEATITTTVYPVPLAGAADSVRVAIGLPLPGGQVYVLDQQMQPLPLGVVGELFVGGGRVAQGYLDRPAQTAERFVPDPWSKQAGRRLYRTGDRVCWRADGQLEFVGRVDEQVKVRGFRVEPAEIEAALLAHPAVCECVVLLREDRPGDARLVAYVVEEPRTGALWAKQEPGDGDEGTKEQKSNGAPSAESQEPGAGDERTKEQRSNGAPSAENHEPGGRERENNGTDQGADADGSQLSVLGSVQELRDFLTERLPDYMIPAAFVLLPALPLTPNGKLDRRALAAPAPSAHGDLLAAPRTPVEEVLAEIWAAVLGVAQVGIDQNFFALGGHSLLVTQVLSRIQSAFAVTLPLRALFEAPTVRTLARSVEQARRETQVRSAPALQPMIYDGPLPLSSAQQRLWFLQQLMPDSPFYNISSVVRLHGALDPAALHHSLNAIVRRHAILRTTLALVDGQPSQIIAPTLTLALPLDQVRADDPAALDHTISAEIRQPFTSGPLLRTRLMQLGVDEWLLIVTMHHSVADGWSLTILIQELATFYRSAREGSTALLPPLAVQYADYALWQRAWLDSDAAATQLSYWKARLAGAPPLLMLPTDRPRTAVQSFHGAKHRFTVPRAQADALIELGRQEGCTLFMVLLAVWQTLLHRWSGQDDIVVGAPIAGRTEAETELLIGCFVNTLALRTDLGGNPRFRDLLQQVRETCLEAYAHQDLPFEHLVQQLQVERDLSRTPLFQALLVLQNMPLPHIDLPELAIAPVEVDHGTAQFDLMLDVADSGDGLAAALTYSTDLFDAATIERMARQFQMALAEIVAHPERRIAALELLTPAEQQLAIGNGAAATPGPTACLHQLFEQQAGRTPDAIALVYEATQLSYDELNRRSNQLAHALRRCGVGPEAVVGICMERSAELVIGLLGILKAGAAYLPLDPAYPSERLSYMLRQARVAVVVTQAEYAPLLSDSDSTLICLHRDAAQLRDESEANLSSAQSPETIAYIIYTSGSTGQPKGVQVTHRNVARLMSVTASWLQPGPGDTWTLFHSYAFDFSVWELWGALLYGGRLVVVPYLTSRTPDAFYNLLRDQRVTVLNQTPSAFRQLVPVATAQPASALALRSIIFGGEALDPALLPDWFAHFGDRQPQLVNMYGITETTVHVTYRPLTLADADPGRGSRIGRPLADLQLYVLDQHGYRAPIGTPGELHVGGAGVARGYLDRPALTAERFVPDPFAQRAPAQPGARLYRTGDLVRLLPDGDLVYLGRIDQQVKIRGFRIEPGEIEAVLAQHPAVREAVVVAREDVPGDRQLVAYVVGEPRTETGEPRTKNQEPGERELRTKNQEPGERELRTGALWAKQEPGEREPGDARTKEQGSNGARSAENQESGAGDERTKEQGSNGARSAENQESGEREHENNGTDQGADADGSQFLVLSSSELRAFLDERLPAHMLPAVFVELDALPLTPSGKLDRRALPAPAVLRPTLDAAYVEPRTSLEQTLAEVWAKVLRIDRVGVHDNFFALGGDSMRSMLIVAEARARGIELSLQQLFQHQTIAALARSAQDAPITTSRQTAPFSLISTQDRQRLPATVEDAYPPTRLQLGMLFHSDYNQGINTYRNISTLLLQAPFDPAAMRSAVAQLISRHAVLRTSFDLTSYSQPLQLVHRAVELPLAIADLRDLAPDEQERALAAWIDAEKLRTFDITQPPLIRFQIHQRSATTFQFSWSEHHAILDGWSVASLLTELSQHYLWLLGQEIEPPPPAPTTTFRDYVALERAALESDELQRFWTRTLADATVALLPRWPSVAADVRERWVRVREVAVPDQVSDGLQRLSATAAVPLKSVLLAAHLRVQSLVTGQADVLTGISSHGRSEETDGAQVLGLFINTLPLRLRLPRSSWLHLVQATFAAEQELFAARRYPLAEVQRLSGGRQLFETAFTFNHFHVYQRLLKQETLALLASQNFVETNFTLVTYFRLDPTSQRVQLSFEYDASQLAEQQIDELSGYYTRALAALASDPHQPYHTTDLLSPHEYRRVASWQTAAPSLAAPPYFHERFDQQAARTPEAVALSYGEQQVTYAELNRRANQLAHYLRRHEVGPETIVGVCLAPSVELIVALLAVLKAGGAYLPLDPDYPQERLGLMLHDAQAAYVITRRELAARCSATSAPVLCLEDLPLDREPSHTPASIVVADNLAYVIYTSGSTGRPKGTLLLHGGLAHFTAAVIQTLAVTADSRVLQFAAASFDASISEIVMALGAGATLVLADRAQLRAMPQLIDLVRDAAITTVTLPPALLAVLPADELTTLQTIVSAGERCSWEIAADWAGPRALFNGYGPTETTIGASYYRVGERLPGLATVPLGTPIAQAALYVLDAQMQPVPVGVPGELAIGGAGLARGYLNQPALTAERFVPDPFNSQHGARLYRTGDLVRYWPDGSIEFLGRIDDQLKLRGFRVEPGEIEAALREHPQVRDAVVLGFAATPDETRLAAYVTEAAASADGERDVLDAAQVSSWAALYDELYDQSLASTADPTFNIQGWASSYTGLPLPADEMREWVDQTVARILRLRPRRVLEVGCGSGLLLYRIAPHCAAYVGTDISGAAIAQLQAQLDRPGLALPHVQVFQRGADALGDLLAEPFDVIIINSVVQYFPSGDYLERVLHQLVGAISAGGWLFVGDVRSLPLLPAFHTSVQLHQAADTLTGAQLRQQVQTQIAHEHELLIDPAFFAVLAQQQPRISQVRVALKRGGAPNELTRYRYDVLLHVAASAAAATPSAWLGWAEIGSTVAALRDVLHTSRPALLAVTGVPNARVEADLLAASLLADPSSAATAGDLRALLVAHSWQGVAPEELYALADELGYDLEIGWTAVSTPADYDLLFQRRAVTDSSAPPPLPPGLPYGAAPRRFGARYTTTPQPPMQSSALAADVRRWLAERLPAYLIPETVLVLPDFPLTVSGKVDRQVLAQRAPAPDAGRLAPERPYVAPRTPLETTLATLWAEVFGWERVGIHDDFFELGGHSLLAVQLIARLRSNLRLDLPLRQLYAARTVAALAALISETHAADADQTVSTPDESLPQIVADPTQADAPFALIGAAEVYWIGRSGYFDLGASGSNVVMEFEIAPADMELPVRFDLALQRLIERHAMLRAIILPDGRQRVLASVPPYHSEVTDLRERDAQAIEATLEPIREHLRTVKAPIERWPLFECRAYLLPAQRVRYLVRIEALLIDGRSRSLLMRELASLLADPDAPLAPLPCSYRDYVLAWQAFQAHPLYQRAKAYWHERVPTLPPAADLPLVRPLRPDTPARFVTRDTTLLEAAAWSSLKARALAAGLTPSALVLAAFVEVLAAWSSRTRFTLGLVSSERLPFHPAIDRVVGNFNTLVLLAVEERAATFEQRARQLQEQLTTDLDYRYVSGLEVLRAWKRAYGRNSHAAMPILFNAVLEHGAPGAAAPTPSDAVLLPYEFRELSAGAYTPQVLLVPTLTEHENGALLCSWQALDELFPPGMSVAMLGAYTDLLRDLAARPEIWHTAAPALVAAPAVPPQPPQSVALSSEPVAWWQRDDTEEIERRLALLWAELFDLRAVAVTDDFFELGGDSLLAVRLMLRVREEFVVQPSLARFYEHPTIRHLARLLL